MKSKQFDVIIVGAGPAGCACALALKDAGLHIGVVDKSSFPRDKICGDAMSLDVVNQVRGLVPDFDFSDSSLGVKMKGVRIYSTKRDCLDLPFPRFFGPDTHGATMRRLDFDNQLVDHMKCIQNLEFLPDQPVQEIHQDADGVMLTVPGGSLQAPMVVGADGAQSVISRKLGNHKLDRKHHLTAVRAYYQNVDGVSGSEGVIEFHLFKDLLPGYFWVFPLSDNEVNVGLGLLSGNSRKVNLRHKLESLIKDHPHLAARFAGASQVGPATGFGIPVGSRRRKVSGTNYLLAGDAAGVVDPLTGEGIANALRSGRLAAEQIKCCFQNQDFSDQFNRKYDQRLYQKIGRELTVSRYLRSVISAPFLADTLIRVLSRSQALQRRLHNFLIRVVSSK